MNQIELQVLKVFNEHKNVKGKRPYKFGIIVRLSQTCKDIYNLYYENIIELAQAFNDTITEMLNSSEYDKLEEKSKKKVFQWGIEQLLNTLWYNSFYRERWVKIDINKPSSKGRYMMSGKMYYQIIMGVKVNMPACIEFVHKVGTDVDKDNLGIMINRMCSDEGKEPPSEHFSNKIYVDNIIDYDPPYYGFLTYTRKEKVLYQNTCQPQIKRLVVKKEDYNPDLEVWIKVIEGDFKPKGNVIDITYQTCLNKHELTRIIRRMKKESRY